jgi:hypothetical protein
MIEKETIPHSNKRQPTTIRTAMIQPMACVRNMRVLPSGRIPESGNNQPGPIQYKQNHCRNQKFTGRDLPHRAPHYNADNQQLDNNKDRKDRAARHQLQNPMML